MKTSAAAKISTQQRCTLEVRKGPDKGTRFALKPPKVSIGRGDDCDIPLQDPRVSRLQANIEFRSDHVYLVDVSSRDNLILNDELVQESPLHDGDVIQMGDSEIVFQVEEQEANGTERDPIRGTQSRDDRSREAQVAADQNRNAALAVASPRSPALTPYSPQAPVPPTASNSSRLPGATPGGSPSKVRDLQVDAMDARYFEQPRQSHMKAAQADTKKLRFYVIILVVGGVFAWLLMWSKPKGANDPGLRTSEQIAAEIKSSAERLEIISKQREFKSPEEKTRYEEANIHYLQGFRDFQKRSFSRAMRSFETARAIDPGHEMAKRYYQLAARKRDEFISQSLLEGRRYKEKNMHARCVSSLQSALKTLGDSVSEQDLREKEIKALLQECDALTKARF